MGKDAKAKESGGKGKGKQAAGASDDSASKGKGKAAKADGLGTCTYVKGCFFPLFCFLELQCFFNHNCSSLFSVLIVQIFYLFVARHILCEKQGKINEAYKKLQDGWLSNGDKVPPAEFAKVISSYIIHCFWMIY